VTELVIGIVIAIAAAVVLIASGSSAKPAELGRKPYAVRGVDKLSDAALRLVEDIASDLGIDPAWLLGVMAFESGFKPNEVNKFSGATGLIQWMPKWKTIDGKRIRDPDAERKAYGASLDELAAMTVESQLPYVHRFFTSGGWKGKLKSFLDTYLAVFYPVAVGESKGDGHVLFSKGTKAYEQNSGMDADGDGNVTRGDVRKRIGSVLTGESPAPALAPSGRVLVLGDSLAYGIGQQLTAQSSKATNHGKPSTVVKAIKPDAAEVKGSRVIVATATNDLAGSRELADIAADLEGLTEQLDGADTLRVFVPLHPLAKEPLRGRAQAFRDLLRQRDRFAPGVLVEDPTPDRDRTSDGIHYTPTGYARLAKLLTGGAS
jgi:hypothetical protein